MSEGTADNPTPVKKKRHGCLRGCVIFALVIFAIIVVGVLTTGDFRSDASVLKNYQPTAEFADIALKNTYTDKGKAMLYRTDPQFVNGETFRATCAADGIEGLACTDTRKTTLLQIDDPEFSDHKYSATTHEMLHVAYHKLTDDETTQVNALLDQELLKHKDDYHLTGILDMLKEKKAGDATYVYSELHSKFGVEYTDLIPELEEHYKLYFNNRAEVVRLYREGGFNSRVRRIDQLNAEGVALETKMNALDSTLRSLQAAGVANEDVDAFNAKVNQFNSMVRQYNAKAAESQKVFSEIETFYRYFNPNYKSPTAKTEQ
ncbi:MAG: hypothetical protein NUV80_00385 [Candidatus Berkelbacteria bacterium]|nr:hypothetical protein [Candidatus Berkelbacteria bacterium]MCR4307005.1 hypothetical protein [Candidatus Berkelbacteria bacterium]